MVAEMEGQESSLRGKGIGAFLVFKKSRPRRESVSSWQVGMETQAFLETPLLVLRITSVCVMCQEGSTKGMLI